MIGEHNKKIYEAADKLCFHILQKTKSKKIKWQPTNYGFLATTYPKLHFIDSRSELCFQPPGTPWTLHLVITKERFSELLKIVSGKNREIAPANYRYYYTIRDEQLPRGNNISSHEHIQDTVKQILGTLKFI